MGWGHILLYPDRLTGILHGGAQKQRMDDAGDGFMALLGAGKTGRQVGEGVSQRLDIAARVAEYFGPWIASGGPFQGAAASLESNFDRLDEKLGAFLHTLAETPSVQWRVSILAKLDASFDLLAPIDARAVVRFLRGELEAAIDLLKLPVRNGPRNIEAHRALRAAVALRRMLRPAFAVLDDAEDALAGLNLKAQLRLAVRGLLERLQPPDFERLQALFKTLDASLGVMLRAGSGFRVEIAVSADGPQFATTADPAARFEAQAVPHTKAGDAVWVTDLVTNIMASLSLLWELIRTAAFAKRPLDGIMMLLGLVWQISRTVIRAGFAEKVNAAMPASGAPAFDFKNWLFTDQADFSMNMIWRILGSLHEHHAPSNWYLSVFRRLLGYVSHVSNWRMPYQFARSIWYMMALRGTNPLPPVAPSRLLMLALGPAWFVAIICAIAIPWESFELENMSGGLVACIVIPVVVFLFALIFFPKFFLNDFFPQIALDRFTNLVLGIAAVFGCIVTALLIGELEMKDAGLQTALAAVLWVVLGLAVVMAGLTMFEVDGLQQVFHAQAGLLGLLMAALLFFLWYFYIDDGRDKPGVYEPLDASKSPFRLPFPKDDNWLCGQSSHGIFSHVMSSPSNHYSFDFNHEPRADGLVARDGIVIQLREDRQDDLDKPNTVAILHTSWSGATDPGTDNERILTYTEFVHISQGSVRVSSFDRVRQGDHLVQIDNNGRSAQHHLHFGNNAAQGNGGLGDINVPVVFADDSTRWFRNYPLLAWFPGKGHIPGKPISMAFYVSGNEKRKIGINPRVVALADSTLAGATSPHTHTLLIDSTLLGTSIPDQISLQSTIDQGHSHSITLSRDQIQALMEWQDSAATTDDTLGHSHSIAPLPHRRVETRGGGSAREITIAQPPGAFLTAQNPIPYALAGARFALRVDEGQTEFHDFLADPARFLSDVAVDLGLASTEVLAVGTISAKMNHASGRLGVKATAAAASRIWRAAAVPGAEARPVALGVPALVIETRQGGSAARLEFQPGSTLPLTDAAPLPARGSGAVPDGSAVSRADLAALLAAGLNTGQAVAAGIVLGKATLATGLDVAVGGVAANFSGGSSRLDAILSRLYTPSAMRLPSTGTVPLGPGRLGINAIAIPIHARTAHQRFATTGDPFNAANLTQTPLVITLRGVRQELFLAATDTTPDAVARAVNAGIEGVRAFVEGTDCVIETIDGGPDARLQVDKAAVGGTALALAVATGASPAGNGLTSACAMPLAVLARQIEEAQSAATLPYDPAVIVPTVVVNVDRIEVSVAAGHTIAVEAVEMAGPGPLLAFEPPVGAPGVMVRTLPLPSTLALRGAGWVDFRIDATHRVRVAIDTERARLELPPLSRLPTTGERLVVAVNGAAPITVTFAGTEASLAAVANSIADALPDCLVRIAYRMMLTDAFRGDIPANAVALGATANGLRQMGFLGDLAATTARHGFFASDSPGRDGLEALPDGKNDAPWRLEDPRRTAGDINPALLTVTDGGAGNPITLSAPAGSEVQVATQHAADPFGLVAAGTASSIATPAFAAGFAWGRTALRHRIEVVQTGTGRTARTWMCLQALPALLHAARPPAALAAEPRTLALTITPPGASARTHAIDLSGIALFETDLVAAAIVAAVPGVRAWGFTDEANRITGVDPARLHIETVGAGTGWRLALEPLELAGLLGFAVEAATGSVLEAAGDGDVADNAVVTRAELMAGLTRAASLLTLEPATPPTASGKAQDSFATTAVRAAAGYAARREDNRLDRFLRYQSSTLGSRSSIECIEQAGRGLRFPAGLFRTPACRGAVVIAPLAAGIRLDGALHIEFNEPPPGSALLAPTLIFIPFAPGTYSAAQIAAAIHAAAVAANAGTATLFPDGSIVIESAQPGLLGSVRLPAAGTPRAVADVLLGPGRSQFGRGWPDVGRRGAGSGLRVGYRSRSGAAAAGALWSFKEGKNTVSVTVGVGDTAEQLADRLNQQFSASPPAMGVAASVDGVLFVETRVDGVTLLVNGAAQAVDPVDRYRPWLTPERTAEPAFDLRRTDEVRTVRLARGRAASFDPADADDWGWLRIPFDSSQTPPVVGRFRALPPGHYAIDLRSDAAKATGYDAAAARIAAADAGGTLVHAVRYGVKVQDRSAWDTHRLADGELGEEWSL